MVRAGMNRHLKCTFLTVGLPLDSVSMGQAFDVERLLVQSGEKRHDTWHRGSG